MGATIWTPGTVIATNVTAQGATKETQNLAAAQTLVTFATITYTTGIGAIYVYLNGSLQIVGQDYIESSSTSITLTSAAILGDVITIMGVVALTTTTSTVGQQASATEVNLASQATVDLGNALASFVRITGTSQITSFGVLYRGPIFVRFAGSLTLTNSSQIILPGGVNITTQTGDTLIAVPKATSGVPDGWVVSVYTSASGNTQSWQTFTTPTNRNNSVTYTNSTSREITLSITGTVSAGTVVVGGVTLYSGTNATTAVFSFPVPVGNSYSVTGFTFGIWAEKR
jgi:hypothetical protein